ncbi:E3 ubiquitin-protein ligase TRAIP-like [Culicoides brevitarsis]|uniref:E3 ubiquitin-protein ligase TRAIP-like n=1 Tax=Culicoides brevitarsis TaxID=469753 RepID=UPI00307C5397
MNVSAACIICLVPYSEDLEIVSLSCHHCFHRNCIKEWLKIRSECPQCRKLVKPKHLNRVILSFESGEKFIFDENSHKIDDLEQQLLSKDKILTETDTEVQRMRQKLKKQEKIEADLRRQIKVKDAVINQSLFDVRDIEKMLLDLESASLTQSKEKEEEIKELTLRLKLQDQLLQDFQSKSEGKSSENEEIRVLERKLKETTKELQSLQSKFDQIMSIVDKFKLEKACDSLSKVQISSNEVIDLTIDDLL